EGRANAQRELPRGFLEGQVGVKPAVVLEVREHAAREGAHDAVLVSTGVRLRRADAAPTIDRREPIRQRSASEDPGGIREDSATVAQVVHARSSGERAPPSAASLVGVPEGRFPEPVTNSAAGARRLDGATAPLPPRVPRARGAAPRAPSRACARAGA